MFNTLTYILGTIISPKIYNHINLNRNKNKDKELVYVVGNGWASYYFVKNLDKSQFEPIIIAPNENVLNTPKLINRVIDPSAIVNFSNPYAKKIKDLVKDIDVEKKNLITTSGSKFPYNRVVFAIGSEPNDFGIQGVNKHTYKFKTIQDADLLRNQISNQYDQSLNSTIYIIGSGVTGIELGSKLDSSGIRIKIIEGMSEILPGYNDRTKSVIYNYITKLNNHPDIKLSHMIKSIDYKQIMMELKDKTIINEHYSKISDIIIWTGGVRFNGFGKTELFRTLNNITPIKPRGLEVEPNFTLKNNDMIYCLGDMVGNQGPPTAQNAKNQGIWLAGYFNSGFDSNYIKSNPYKTKSKGKLVHLADKVYLESDYYSGFIPNFVGKIIELIE